MEDAFIAVTGIAMLLQSFLLYLQERQLDRMEEKQLDLEDMLENIEKKIEQENREPQHMYPWVRRNYDGI